VEEPAFVAEEVLHAVEVGDPGDPAAGHVPRRGVPHFLQIGRDHRNRQQDVPAVVREAAEF
jgi:hypothetical protein